MRHFNPLAFSIASARSRSTMSIVSSFTVTSMSWLLEPLVAREPHTLQGWEDVSIALKA
jgi:hypothetical protein